MGGVAAAASGMLPTQDPGTAHHEMYGLEPPPGQMHDNAVVAAQRTISPTPGVVKLIFAHHENHDEIGHEMHWKFLKQCAPTAASSQTLPYEIGRCLRFNRFPWLDAPPAPCMGPEGNSG
jgi:hypothetical protein